MKEQEKYEIIKKLVETSGNKDNAALKLSVSRRQINRMMKGYKEQGKAFFVHGNRGANQPQLSLRISENVSSLFIRNNTLMLILLILRSCLRSGKAFLFLQPQFNRYWKNITSYPLWLQKQSRNVFLLI